MKCDKCGYSDNGSGDWAHVCGSVKIKKNDKCVECDKPATWMRCTQFAGDHPYCEYHAKLEPDFEDSDSYHFWKELKNDH